MMLLHVNVVNDTFENWIIIYSYIYVFRFS